MVILLEKLCMKLSILQMLVLEFMRSYVAIELVLVDPNRGKKHTIFSPIDLTSPGWKEQRFLCWWFHLHTFPYKF